MRRLLPIGLVVGLVPVAVGSLPPHGAGGRATEVLWSRRAPALPSPSSKPSPLPECRAGEIVWQRILGGRGPEWVTSLDVFADGGIAASGFTNDSTSQQGWVLRYDADGNLLWDRMYGGAGLEYAEFLQALPDGGVVAVGATYPRGAKVSDGWVFRLDARGDVLWDEALGRSRRDRIDAVRALPDGGFVASGDSEPDGEGPFDAWVIRLDGDGRVLWQKTYGGPGRDEARFIESLSDGGFAVAGLTTSRGAGDEDAWILRLDSAGSVVWEATVGGAALDRALELREVADGDIVAVGITHSRGDPEDADALAVKLDGQGREVWERAIGQDHSDDSLWGLWPLADGGAIAVGNTPGGAGRGQDGWLVRLDAAGTVVASETCGTGSPEALGAVQVLPDGGVIAGGNTRSPGAEYPDVWLVRLAAIPGG